MASTVSLRPISDDLWATAVNKLSDDDKLNVDFDSSDKLKVLSELLAVTEQSREECIKKRWRYTRKSGETVIFRDLLGKVVKWIDLFKQIGDVAVQYDPGHAALPWAGVRFLLQITVNDFAKFAFVVEGAAAIAEMICRYAIIEDLYLRSASTASDKLRSTLVHLYTNIMVYLSKAKSFFLQNSAKRIIKSGLVPESDLATYFNSISAAQGDVDRYLILVNAQDEIDRHTELKNILQQIDSPLKRMSDDMKTVKDDLGASKRTEILRWLSPEPYIQHHEQTKKDVLPETGKWLLSDSTFDKWKKESVSSILWLHGIPGSGKSKLASIVIEDAFNSFQTGQSPPPAFFYCSRNTAEPSRSSPEAIMASIARQLSSLQPGDPLLNPSITIYKQREASGFASGSLRIEESKSLILQLIEHYPLTIIVLDALDECDPEKRGELLEILESILQDSSRLVKVFVSSRDDQDIVCHLEGYPNLGITSDRNMEDIASFVKIETQDLIKRKRLLRFSNSKAELEAKIIRKVTEGAGGMFRWASLQLQSLCELKTDEAVRQRIGRLPPKLEDLYVELYDKINRYTAEADRRVTMHTLSWLLCAQRTLKSAEFLAALSITPGGGFSQVFKDQVLDICCNLVVFDSALDTFRFAHLSVREFLEKQAEFSPSSTNALAAETCLLELLSPFKNPNTQIHLSQDNQPVGRESPFASGFRIYTTLHWARHCQLAAAQRTKGSLKDVFQEFLSIGSLKPPALTAWTRHLQELSDLNFSFNIDYRMYRQLKDIEAAIPTTALFLACSFDFPEVIVDQASAERFLADQMNKANAAALQVAIQYGSCEVLSVFLSNASTKVTEEVVLAAVRSIKGSEIMTLLLGRRGDEVRITEEVLKVAAERNGGVMALLLDRRGDEVRITEGVVKAAAWSYDSRAMALLLDRRGDEVRITEEVVKAAAGNHNSEKVALLLDRRGDEVKITEEVIKAAARSYYSGVMALLLDRRGDEVRITEEVVKAAARNHDSRVMALLLDRRGDEVRITEEVVKAAAWSYDSRVMALLLDRRGDEVKITEDVVKAAAANGGSGKKILTFLLERRGDEVKITEGVVKAAAANEESGKDVMDLLLTQRRASVVPTRDVIIAAITSGQEDMLRVLEKEFGISVSKDEWLCAQFYDAARTGEQNKIELLLPQVIEPDRKNIRNVSPLWIAATRGHLEVVKLLLKSKKVDVNSESTAGRPPIFWAAASGYKEIVNLLLQAGAEPNPIDEDGQTPMLMARKYGHDDIVDLLSRG